jgi:hypothetical protein
MKTRPAHRTLRELFDAANRKHGDDEEESDKLHPFLQSELADRATLAALHLLRQNVRPPGEKTRADDEEEEHLLNPLKIKTIATVDTEHSEIFELVISNLRFQI